eukprot:Clim_evm100s147 gene=Clim_evmTU100s147
MDPNEFRKHGHAMVEWIAEYYENLDKKEVSVLPSVQPDYLKELIPKEAPEQPESFEQVMEDVNTKILPGVTHWQHPNFYAYYPAGTSHPATLADMLSGALGSIGFTWISTPACTELEIIVMDWMARGQQLPDCFLSDSETGGGVIQGTASEAALVTLLAAKKRQLIRMNKLGSGEEGAATDKFIVYVSDQSHNSGAKNAKIAQLKLRTIKSEPGTMRITGAAVKAAMEEDDAKGLIPIYVMATAGTTSSCAFDDLQGIGKICSEKGIWMHIDSAYAGTAFFCPEHRPLLDGVEYAESYNFNPHKWMMVNFDCSALWVKNKNDVLSTFSDNPIFLQYKRSAETTDYKNWQIPLGRRFRALKLWFVMRMFGLEGIRKHVRLHCRLNQHFAALVEQDDRFAIVAKPMMGLTCFALKAGKEATEHLLDAITKEGEYYMIQTQLHDVYCIRFAITNPRATEQHIQDAWTCIQRHATEVLNDAAGQQQNGVNGHAK